MFENIFDAYWQGRIPRPFEAPCAPEREQCRSAGLMDGPAAAWTRTSCTFMIIAVCKSRFMESPRSFFRTHWDHELDRGRSPSAARSIWNGRWEVSTSPAVRRHCDRGPVAVRFMGSLHGHLAAHWDHELAWEIQSAAAVAHSKTWRKFGRLWPTGHRLGVRRGSFAFDGSVDSEFVRFMGFHGLKAVLLSSGSRAARSRGTDGDFVPLTT